MRIRSLEAFELPVKLRRPIRHASHVRHRNDTLIVRCELDDGHVGWGEGLPRPYVTGETIDSVWRHLTATDFAQLADLAFNAPTDIVPAFDRFRLARVNADPDVETRECFGNTVRCAIELSLLDAVCRSARCSVGDLLRSLPETAELAVKRQEVRYSGVITSSRNAISQYRSAIRMRLFGFQQVKVKVGADDIDDVACLRRVRRVLGRGVDLRLDANEAWHADDVAANVRRLEQFQPTCLEQPVSHGEVAALSDIRREVTIPIMLDESLCCREDADRAIADGTCDLFNLRISKCGGLISCVRLAALAQQHELGYQLGCLVGETGILSAAGRQFACSIANIRYLEGSYDRFLVRDALTAENLTFGYRGRAPALDGRGLGITVDEATVRSLAKRTLRIV